MNSSCIFPLQQYLTLKLETNISQQKSPKKEHGTHKQQPSQPTGGEQKQEVEEHVDDINIQDNSGGDTVNESKEEDDHEGATTGATGEDLTVGGSSTQM
jgi:hypothetical protein